MKNPAVEELREASNVAVDARDRQPSLVTRALQQRFDLVEHLLCHSRQACIVTGPTGIGKSWFIDTLKQRLDDTWKVAYADGGPTVNARQLLRLLADALELTPDEAIDDDSLWQAVQQQAAQLAVNDARIVLIIDDCAELPVDALHLLSKLLSAAPETPLRVLLSATDAEQRFVDAMQKDLGALASPHVIPLPRFTVADTGELLAALAQAAGSARRRLWPAKMVAKIHAQAGGIPETILTLGRQHLMGTSFGAPVLSPLWLVSVSLVLLAVVAWSWSRRPSPPPPESREPVVELQHRAAPSASPGNIRPPAPAPEAPPLPSEPSADESLITIPVSLPPAAATSPARSHGVLSEELEEPLASRSPVEPPVLSMPSPSRDEPPDSAATPDAEPTLVTVPPPPAEADATPAALPPTAPPATPPPDPHVASQDDALEAHTDTVRAAYSLAWLRRQAAGGFYLQLLGVRDQRAARAFIARHGIGDRSAVATKEIDGRPMYVVVYGYFPSKQAAQAAIAELPRGLRKLKPWVRPLRALP